MMFRSSVMGRLACSPQHYLAAQAIASRASLPTYEMAKNGRVLLSSDVAHNATHGWPEYVSIYQPSFEFELDVIVKALPTVDVFPGEFACSLTQDSSQVEIEVENKFGQRRRVEGQYLIGCDGGNSFVRGALGVKYEDLGFKQDWLVVDAEACRRQRTPPISSPVPPGLATLRSRRRFLCYFFRSS
jgi:2-polyprenyl-6-methoxyphenol hydroxylase-like FAD-dependent oxidoreductase